MELEEFRELALQTLPKVSRGRTVRYTLVRTPGEFFLNKIHRQQYLELRSIPLVKNYRFIQSTLTHGEYTTFREDFYRDFDFLKIRDSIFSGLVETAQEMEFELYGFSSSGKGRLDVKSPPDNGHSSDLVDLMNENASKGMKPFLMIFKRDRCKVTIRKDFNYFIHGGYWDAMPFIYTTSRKVIDGELELLEKLSSVFLRNKLNDNDFIPMSRVALNIHGEGDKGRILDKLRSSMSVGEIRDSDDLTSIYAFQKGNESASYRVDISKSEVTFLPTVTSRMEGLLDILEFMEEG